LGTHSNKAIKILYTIKKSRRAKIKIKKILAQIGGIYSIIIVGTC